MSRNNKSLEEQAWMRTNGLSAYDWAVTTEYMDAPKPLKTATRPLEGRGKQGSFVAIAEIMLVSFNCYEERVDSYGVVNHNAHDEALENHFGTNLNAAWAKANDYYDRPDDTAIYYGGAFQKFCLTLISALRRNSSWRNFPPLS